MLRVETEELDMMSVGKGGGWDALCGSKSTVAKVFCLRPAQGRSVLGSITTLYRAQ